MDNKKRNTVNTLCLVLIAAFLVFFMIQMGNMSKSACLFFDINGLPTLANAVCGIVFGILFIVLGRNIDVKRKSLRTLCKVIGILEIISAVLSYLMTLLINSQI